MRDIFDVSDTQSNPFATNLINLASSRLGSRVLYATDDFFAAKERLIKDEEPRYIQDKFDDHGKWMDGWESRRRRDSGYDYCIIELKAPGIIKGVDVDTRHFTGNHPPHISIDATFSENNPTGETVWSELVPKSEINPDCHNFIEVLSEECFSHLRLNIYPDGGIARLRVYGKPFGSWQQNDSPMTHELTAIINGGHIVGYNDSHYGDPWVILTPGRGINMGDGWETRRRREPGNDWIVVALGTEGIVERIEVDTAHFKGNYPDCCSVEATKFLEDNEDILLNNGYNGFYR